MQPPVLVILDLDGTLVDSADGIVHAAVEAFASAGLAIADAFVRGRLGAPLDELWALVDGPAEGYAAFEAAYQAHYDEHGYAATRAFPRVAATLARLAEQTRLAVATTKPTWSAERTLEAAGLREHVHLVQGTDGFPHKPDPTIVHRVLDRAGVPAHRALMVGDTERDVLAGRAAGTGTCAVTYGARPAGALRAVAPDHVIDCFSELAGLVLGATPAGSPT